MAFRALEELPFIYPTHFPQPIYDFKKSPLKKEKVELGKKLFFDPILSKNNTISCASCHLPSAAFSHAGEKVSKGIYDSVGSRNTPSLFNLAWQKHFMWDGAIPNLDYQALTPINHPKEMGESTITLVEKLNSSGKYRNEFKQAYGDPMATAERILQTLTQYQLTLISATSKYDLVMQGKAEFTESEKLGYATFKEKKCNNCHTEPLFSNNEFENIGLTIHPLYNDKGRITQTKIPSDELKFKTPTLRNLSYTAPYMHDGRYKNLDQAIIHYQWEVERGPNVSKELTYPIVFSRSQLENLKAFLRTLDDSTFVNDPNHRPN